MPSQASKIKKIIRFIRPSVRKLKAYTIDETPCRIKLDAMENAGTMPEEIQQEIAEAARTAQINRYPDPSAKQLKQAIAEFWNIDAEKTILGNGSDELIQAIILAFGGPVLFPVPTFAMYEIISRALSQEVATIPLTKDFSLDPDRLIRKARETKARVIFLACPNNPTGNRFSDEAIRKILDKANAAVVIDEAYFDFSGTSFLPSLEAYPNMIILRTLSKIGFAGLRVGALIAAPEVLSELNKIRLPYNINVLSQAAAGIALKHKNVLEQQISLLISERERLYNALSQMPGIVPSPSETNFILFRTDTDATGIYNKLKQAGILVKNLDKPGPLKNCLRVTVGTPEENNEFVRQVQQILATDLHG
ncbi:MAG TPA: histidinol-phosphate transaminase [Nitrospiraceae bacterium]|nr:histidinol-phosphate transaminase [Nitrospiraceae bacterium]